MGGEESFVSGLPYVGSKTVWGPRNYVDRKTIPYSTVPNEATRSIIAID
jgi:hypothetical protein